MDITDLFPSPWFTEEQRAEHIENVTQQGDCWVWTGPTQGKGYGQIFHLGGVLLMHRVSYFIHVGPIPKKLHIDHRCRNKACLRPSHLEAVTPRVNVVVRGTGITALNVLKTHCPAGHEYDYTTPDGKRGCKMCRSNNRKAYRARQKAAGLPPR